MRQHTLMRLVVLAIILWLIHGAARATPVTYAQIRKHLIQWEGYRPVPYRDGSAGWSVGVGHSLTAHGETKRARYTATQIERWLTEDCCWALDACRGGIERFDDLPRDIQLVCLGVAFTTGRTGFARFVSFRRAISWRAYEAARTELGTSRWATQVSAARHDAYIGILRSQP